MKMKMKILPNNRLKLTAALRRYPRPRSLVLWFISSVTYFHQAAARTPAEIVFIRSRSFDKSWRVNFHSNGFAIAS